MLRQCNNLPKLRNLFHLRHATTPTPVTFLARSIRRETTKPQKVYAKQQPLAKETPSPPPRKLSGTLQSYYRTLTSPYHNLRTRYHALLSSYLTTITITLTLFLTWHIISSYFYTFPACSGVSMVPTLASYGDWVLISKYYRRGRGVMVGDLVSFEHPVDEGVGSVKRVVGMGGDFVLVGTPEGRGDGRQDGWMIQLPEGHCWVVGDNLPHSRDSRLFGPLPLALVKGKVIAKCTGSWNPLEMLMSWRWMENGLKDAEDEDDVD